ncbi:MAG: ABC transporter permease [Chloroflexi bacterium]|nr:ABC transporter permease [Chloroflexota bacterium]
MLSTIIRRLLQGFIVICAITIITFIMLRMIPGDPSRTMAPNATEDQLIMLRDQMGINEPILVQLTKYIRNIFQGEFGYSFFQRANVIKVIAGSLNASIVLFGFALVLSIFFGLLFGIIAALKANTWIDKLFSSIAVVFQSMPNYWVGTMLILFISVKLQLLPATGYEGFKFSILPGIALSLPTIAVLMRNVRASMISSLRQDFVKAAKARGIPGYIILSRYAFRNSLIPLLTLLGSQLGYMVGNMVVCEYVFSYPGIGLQTLYAILRRDYYLVQGLVVILSGFFIVVNMIIDIGYTYLDPRIRKAQGGL